MNRIQIDPCLEGSATVTAVAYDGTNPDPPHTIAVTVPVSGLWPALGSGVWLVIEGEFTAFAANGTFGTGQFRFLVRGGTTPAVSTDNAGAFGGDDLRYGPGSTKYTHATVKAIVNSSGDIDLGVRSFGIQTDDPDRNMDVRVFVKVFSLTYFS